MLYTTKTGLVINDDQHIMVLDYDYQDIRIVVFDQQGKLIRKFAFKVKNVKNSKCRFMAIVRDKLIVSDLGKYSWTYGQWIKWVHLNLVSGSNKVLLTLLHFPQQYVL